MSLLVLRNLDKYLVMQRLRVSEVPLRFMSMMCMYVNPFWHAYIFRISVMPQRFL